MWAFFLSQGKAGLVTAYRNQDNYDESNMVIDGNVVLKYSKSEKSRDMVYIDYGASVFRSPSLK